MTEQPLCESGECQYEPAVALARTRDGNRIYVCTVHTNAANVVDFELLDTTPHSA